MGTGCTCYRSNGPHDLLCRAEIHQKGSNSGTGTYSNTGTGYPRDADQIGSRKRVVQLNRRPGRRGLAPLTNMALSPLGITSRIGSFLSKNAGVIALVVVVLVAWYWFRPYFRVLFGLVPDDAKFQAGGGDITREFYNNHKDKARRLHDTLTANALTSSGRCESMYDALQWQVNELRLIHNRYKNSYGNTLLEDVQAVYTDDCSWLGMSDGLNEQLVSRLSLNGLT